MVIVIGITQDCRTGEIFREPSSAEKSKLSLDILYNWLIWCVLKLAFFRKSIFPVFIFASGPVRTTPSSCRHIFMRSLIWR